MAGSSNVEEFDGITPSMQVNTSPQRHTCPFDMSCDYTFDRLTAEELKEHYRSFHENSDLAICRWRFPSTGKCCNKLLKDFPALLKHVGQVHLKLSARTCRKCGRKLSRSDALLRHERNCLS